ncbi:MAG TPA: phosphonate C-P lyase system protein PhnH, partial [Actinomycetota bacterium]
GTEARLLRWAQGVSCGAIRRKGDLEARRSRDEAEQVDRDRRLSWWLFDQGRRFALEAELPAAEGAVVATAIQRLATRLPVMPGEEEPSFADARRADALVVLASARMGAEADPDRATVVIHASAETLSSADRSCQVEGGGVAHAETLRRLSCTGRLQAVVEDRAGDPIAIGRASRDPSAFMMRQLRYRDGECRFPGCGARAFTQAHHITWWSRGGRTDLDNLVLICTFHHKLVHEYGWSLRREQDGTVRWFQPDGTRVRAGPAPPRRAIEPLPAPVAVA